MRFAVMPPAHERFLSSPDLIGEYARTAEEEGFESIWVFEHAVIPAGYDSKYPYNAEGRIGIEDDEVELVIGAIRDALVNGPRKSQAAAA